MKLIKKFFECSFKKKREIKFLAVKRNKTKSIIFHHSIYSKQTY